MKINESLAVKIFQTKSKGLAEIKELGGRKAFDYEKMIQNLVERNLNVIFPELEFVTTEYSLEGLRIDSVAFNTETNSFVIIEYKNLKHGGVLDQGLAYLDLLEARPDAFILLYNDVKGKLPPKEIEWEESKVIIIAPEFTPHQLRSANVTKHPIELYQISRFDDEIIALQRIEKTRDSPNKTKTKNTPSIRLIEYSEDDYLAGKYFTPQKTIPDNVKELFITMKNKILETFPELEAIQKSKYAGFYSKKDGTSICSMEITPNLLHFCYAINKPDVFPKTPFIRYMVKPSGEKMGHWGLGDYMSDIKTVSDVDKAISFLGIVYEKKTPTGK